MGWFLGSLPKDLWRLLIRTWLPKCDLAHLREAIFPRDVAEIADIAESIVENHYDNLLESRVIPSMKEAPSSVHQNLVLAAVRTGDKRLIDHLVCVFKVEIAQDVVFKQLYLKEAAQLRDNGEFFQIIKTYEWMAERVLAIVKGPNFIERVIACNPIIDYVYLGFLVRYDCLELFQLYFTEPWNRDGSVLSDIFSFYYWENYETLQFECKRTIEWILETHPGFRVPRQTVEKAIFYATPNTWQWLFKLFPFQLDVYIIQEVQHIKDLDFFHSYEPIFPFSLEACERFVNFRARLDELVWLMQRHETPAERLDELKELMEQDFPRNIERFCFLLTSPQ